MLRYGELLYEADASSKLHAAEISRGITAEFLAGVAGIVLGILALLRIVPMTLMSVAVITYGGTLLLTSGESIWLNSFGKENEMAYQSRHSMGLAAARAQVLNWTREPGARHFRTCRHHSNDDGSGCTTRNRRVNSVAEFVRRWIIARFLVHVSPSHGLRAPSSIKSLAAFLFPSPDGE